MSLVPLREMIKLQCKLWPCLAILNFWSTPKRFLGLSWSYGSWIYNYLCNQCLSSLTLWVRILNRRYKMWWSLSVTCGKSVSFSAGTAVSSTNKTDRHYITEIFLKMALNKPNQTEWWKVMKQLYIYIYMLPSNYAILHYHSIVY